TTDSGMVRGWSAASYDDSKWADMPVPSYWEGNGYEAMDGIAWYRKEFTISAATARAGLRLDMTAIDDDDITWVNGVEVGRTNGYNIERKYDVPPSALREGR